MKHEDITAEKILKIFQNNQSKYTWVMDIKTFKYIQKLQYPDGKYVWEADFKFLTRGLIQGQPIEIVNYECFELRVKLSNNAFIQNSGFLKRIMR